MIGSTNQTPADKLPQDLEDFMQSAGEEGVVLVSFGSLVGQLTERQTEILVNAFSQLKYKVNIGQVTIVGSRIILRGVPGKNVVGI